MIHLFSFWSRSQRMRSLHGRPFKDLDIGGMKSYFELKMAVENILTEP